MGSPTCRSCATRSGHLVLDLGHLPACDHFPDRDDPGPDPRHPLKMWLCASCGLAQLVGERTVDEEPLGTEPGALVGQAADAVGRLAQAGWVGGPGRVAEFGSPHGGSWLDLLAGRGLTPVTDGGSADLVVDSFGMMHAEDQSTALAERLARVAPGGAIALQYHSLGTIVRLGQWNALRHGHFAYYSTNALAGMLKARGFAPRAAWVFDLYGGTVLLVASRESGSRPATLGGSVDALLSDEAHYGVLEPATVARLQEEAESHTRGLRDWLEAQSAAGKTVLGYGAASRAVALLNRAGVHQRLLPGIVDVSPSKHGRRIPGTDIPIIGPAKLLSDRPDAVLLFVPDLLPEVRHTYPEVERAGGEWVNADVLRG